jgi:DNA-binding MarR family transcriptional regulator
MTETTIDQRPEPGDLYVHLVSSFRLSRAVWLALRFRLPDIIGSEPVPARDIARATGTDPDSLKRLLDALTAAGLFQATGPGENRLYSSTPTSELLRSDHPKSQRAWIEVMLGGDHYEAWGSIDESLRTGQTAFDLRYGMSSFEYYACHPEAGRAFAESMTATTRAFEDAIMEADPFPRFTFAVDVGGSHGSFLRRLLERNVEATGVIFDLPDVIGGWIANGYDNLDGRMTGIGGDFFESVPAGGDLYLLKLILHDWDDTQAAVILRRVREAIQPDGKIAIVETVLSESSTDLWGRLKDLNMLAITGGRERTQVSFSRLLDEAGFHLERIVPASSRLSILIASPCPIG